MNNRSHWLAVQGGNAGNYKLSGNKLEDSNGKKGVTLGYVPHNPMVHLNPLESGGGPRPLNLNM